MEIHIKKSTIANIQKILSTISRFAPTLTLTLTPTEFLISARSSNKLFILLSLSSSIFPTYSVPSPRGYELVVKQLLKVRNGEVILTQDADRLIFEVGADNEDGILKRFQLNIVESGFMKAAYPQRCASYFVVSGKVLLDIFSLITGDELEISFGHASGDYTADQDIVIVSTVTIRTKSSQVGIDLGDFVELDWIDSIVGIDLKTMKRIAAYGDAMGLDLEARFEAGIMVIKCGDVDFVIATTDIPPEEPQVLALAVNNDEYQGLGLHSREAGGGGLFAQLEKINRK